MICFSVTKKTTDDILKIDHDNMQELLFFEDENNKIHELLHRLYALNSITRASIRQH